MELVGTRIGDMEVLRWQEKAPGVWSAVIGAPEEMTYLSFAGAAPKKEALKQMPAVKFPLSKEQCRGLITGNRALVRIPLTPDEKMYGLGLQFQGLNRRGRLYHLRVDHYSRGQERTHAPVPFYVSSEGYGVLFNSPRFISIYAGIGNRKDSPNLPVIRDRNTDRNWQAQPTSDAVEASVVSEGMEVLVFAGPTPLDAVRRYNLYCGGGCLPPKWGLGFWHRMRAHASDEEVKKEVAEFKKRDFPLDVIGLEPGWQTKAYPCTYEWNKKTFPQPGKFLAAMKEEGVYINLWENPYVSPHAGIYDVIKSLCGSHMVWLGIVPDYTLEQTQKILTSQHEKDHLDIGVSGYKIDEVDGYDFWLWPDHAVFPSGVSAEQMRQTYGLQWQKMLTGVFRNRNQRTFGQIRASNAGASAYPFVIYSDHYDHRGFVTALVNSGFTGVLWAPEIRSAKSSEEWVRRMQSVCFSHLTQLNGWASNTKPWTFGDVEDEIRAVIQLRTQLLPYVYTAYAKYHFEGTPPIRAMVLEPGYNDKEAVESGILDDAKNPYAMAVRKDVTDQFMVGDCLLVAPIFTGQKKRTVILPQGKWYDFYTGQFIGGSEVITVEPPLDKIPLYVKEGGIIPMIEPASRISKLQRPVKLIVRHYGTKPGSSKLYDDDGLTFDYEKGQYCWYRLESKIDSEGKPQGYAQKISGSWLSVYEPIEWQFMTK
jgi:alpha-D-xyloside xylohydrolase